ncbi:hypothetical protein OG897_37835 [Streptomyces sp. NBC_00237]|uniref:hypothetical protein n=1 Tax=Streptomyces sp. NBC_00237 TaxID=2975687 RepID=UPI002258D9EF|nr:hypothetical protein [Streptomyces sp. NBC_00237]MCX5207154.1 hypothetical protein [Streptomyces sp. NBC_00237]
MPFDPYAALNAMIRAEVRRSSDTSPSPIARRTPESTERHHHGERRTVEQSEPVRRQHRTGQEHGRS